MAYVSQELKKSIAPVIKALLKEYGLKGTLAVRHHSTLVLNIQSGPIDFIGVGNRISRATALSRGHDYYADRDYSQVNVYWIGDHYDGIAREFLTKAYAALKGPDFFDHSDAQTDYFHRSHYQDINIGRYNRPYVLTPDTKPAKRAAKKTAKTRAPKGERTVRATGKTRFYSYSEVQGYDPKSNVEPDPTFSYVATLEQLRANLK
jgi:hypothetical protein